MKNFTNKNWLITNNNNIDCSLPLAYQSHAHASLFISPDNLQKFIISKNVIYVMVDGFIMPQLGFFDHYQKVKAEELVALLFDQYGFSFINHLKGLFILLLIVADTIYIYTDHLGIKRCFYINNQYFQITSALHLLTKSTNLELDIDSIALLSLMHHFIDGRTVFHGIKYTLPASFIEIGDKISFKSYWDLNCLLNLKQKNISFDNFASLLIKLAEAYVQYFRPKKISMTLTGGMDSRTILALFLKLGIKPATFTFGNPLSADVAIARQITAKLNLKHTNHYEQNSTPEWYDSLTNEIVKNGNSLVHLHRAHRIDAIKKEVALHPRTDMLLLGSMGGEGIRGLHYDDLIVTGFVRKLYTKNKDMEVLIKEKCKEYFLRSEKINQNKIAFILKQQKYFQGTSKNKEFFILYDLVAGLHDRQDICMYSDYIKYVVPLFMDIDYLKALFSSRYSMLNKHKTSKNPIKKLNIPAVHCNLIHKLAPQLCNIPFSNGFTPEEYLKGPLSYLGALGRRRIFGKKYQPNFSYTNFFTQFIQNFLDTANDHHICQFYDVTKAIANLKNNQPETKEGYWHKFSNIIMISKFLSYYR